MQIKRFHRIYQLDLTNVLPAADDDSYLCILQEGVQTQLSNATRQVHVLSLHDDAHSVCDVVGPDLPRHQTQPAFLEECLDRCIRLLECRLTRDSVHHPV